MRARGLLIAAAVLTCGYGCTSFGAEESKSDAMAPEGGTGADAMAPEGGPGVDGGSWCSANAPPDAFCADFDGIKSVEAGWSKKQTSANGAVELASVASSAPRSARMTMAPGDADASAPCRSAELVYTSTSVGKKGHLAFDVWVGPGTFTTLVRFGQSGGCAIDIGVTKTGANAFAELNALGTTGESRDLVPPIPDEKWTRVTVDFDFGMLTFSAQHDQGGSKVAAMIPASCTKLAPITVQLGIHCESGGAAAEAYFDNVVMTTPP